ncbi:MAG: haloacid dehalogenase [Nitriliruptor sp.]|nr:MAG: haloacid dehalogenase [Nitriliruptor sp.]
MTASQDLVAAVAPIREQLEARHEAREVALAASRDAIRSAANAIRAAHRGDEALVTSLLTEARTRLDRAVDAARAHPEVLHAGFVADAAKEVAEAELTRAAIAGEVLPGPEALGVDEVAWLHGLAETVGELRRASLDRVRGGDLDTGERYLELMQEILAALVTIDVPDGLSRGLRRATDAARAITERTRGDLTTAVGQRDLRRALEAHREALERDRS